jgi:small-conductance mechanosensitive channel
MTQLPERIQRALEALSRESPAVLTGIGLSLLALVLIGVLRGLVLRRVHRRTDDVLVLYRWRKVSNYLAALAGLTALALIWIEKLRLALTIFGVLSAGVALALSGLIAAMAGWAFILLRRPFEVGDRIQVGDFAGDVIDIRLFKFTLMEIGNWVDADQSTGRVVHVPNGKVLTEVLVNYTRGFHYIWDEIPVLVTFESDWEKAKKILQEIADRHVGEAAEQARLELRKAARRFMLYYSRLTPTVYTKVEDSGVLLTVRHLVEPRKRRGALGAIWEDILRAFADEPDIDFAYPTRRFYDHVVEGKPELRGADERHGNARPPADR